MRYNMKQNTKAIIWAIAVTVISLLINVVALAGKIKAGNMNRWDYGEHWGWIFLLLFVVEVVINIVMLDISYYICRKVCQMEYYYALKMLLIADILYIAMMLIVFPQCFVFIESKMMIRYIMDFGSELDLLLVEIFSLGLAGMFLIILLPFYIQECLDRKKR